MDDNQLNDKELDQLIAMASKPAPPTGFEHRLVSRLDLPASNVIAFPMRKRISPFIIGLPLAASLAVGLWLGVTGLGSSSLSTNTTTLVSDTADDTGFSGFDDVTAFIEGNQT